LQQLFVVHIHCEEHVKPVPNLGAAAHMYMHIIIAL